MGLVATTVGFCIFVVLLLFAMQVTLVLWKRSVLSADAYDAARIVAGSDAGATADSVADADDQLRSALGAAGATATIDWRVDADAVRLEVALHQPTLLPAMVATPLGLNRVSAGVLIRRERTR